MLTIILFILNLIFLIGAALFTYESLREKEPRAPKVGLAGILFHLMLAGLILAVPASRPFAAVFFGVMLFVILLFLIPAKPNPRALKGAEGYLAGPVNRFDERDIVFARNRSLPPGSEQYREYYERHPEKEAYDARRRERGGPIGRPGAIDSGYPPNVSMILSSFALPGFLAGQARVTPDPAKPAAALNPDEAARIIKGFARHLGAALVGICRVNPLWAYSHRGEIFYGNWEDWGKEIEKPLPYAVVIATEMDLENVGAGPHTPALVESSANYALGAYLTTILAQWFGGLGYRAVAQHNRHYDLLLVPLAIDAGLGELGRHGYLVADQLGPRVRLFAVTTDMPLATDKPIDKGIEAFCRYCKKCATACPSHSIPLEEMTVQNGLERWKLNEETCFEYWGKVGTDCSVCMGICPFSRPNRSVHKIVKWLLPRSWLAQRLLPHLDNWVYGQKWKPRKVADWVRYSS
jgi:reductive dehalogenase